MQPHLSNPLRARLRVRPEICITVIVHVCKNAVCARIFNVVIEPNLGLRDRKRLETRLRLEDAAVTLVLRDGLEQTTVDAISELADVSPRTFFNYFGSKDAAILRLRPTIIQAADLAEHCDRVAEHELIDSVIHLLLTVVGPPSARPTMREDRLEILRRHPQLLTTQLAQFTQITTEVTDAAVALVARGVRFAGDSPADLAASADLVLALCGFAVCVAVKEWVATNPTDADSAAEQVELRAISLAREVSVKLSRPPHFSRSRRRPPPTPTSPAWACSPWPRPDSYSLQRGAARPTTGIPGEVTGAIAVPARGTGWRG